MRSHIDNPVMTSPNATPNNENTTMVTNTGVDSVERNSDKYTAAGIDNATPTKLKPPITCRHKPSLVSAASRGHLRMYHNTYRQDSPEIRNSNCH